MGKSLLRLSAAIGLLVLLGACTQRPHTWDPRAAAKYLDHRESWWAGWHAAARDHSTFCVSCHTALPYAMARPALRAALDQSAPSAPERQLLDDVQQRVLQWSQMKPYYAEQAQASRGTEAVLNALVLASADAHRGHLSDVTGAAFEHMWETQTRTGDAAGAWPWIQFDNEPFEAYDSVYYGAALAALAVGLAPDDYRSRPEIQAAMERLRTYLNRGFDAQMPLNRITALWACAHVPQLLSPEHQHAILDDIWARQRTDGGWSTASLIGSWARRDGRAQVPDSDGFATGLITLSLQQTGVSARDPRLARGLAWLEANQSAWNGRWIAYSPNKRRLVLLDRAARFMDDTATGFAVLSLTQSRSEPARSVAERLAPSGRLRGAMP